MMLNIRPTHHTDSGRIERFIETARKALSYGDDTASVHDRLLARGATDEEAHNAIRAAQLLDGDL